MIKQVYDAYINILESELVPALGCTEPIAIAFGAAKAREVLGEMPTSIMVKSSGNIIKNVKGVTVPNSGGLKGILPVAILGAVGGNPDAGLQVLADISDEDIRKTKELLETDFCKCQLVTGVENLYLLIEVVGDNGTASVEIMGEHTNITKLTKNDKTIFSASFNRKVDGVKEQKELLNLKDILTFADTVELGDVRELIQRQIELNSAIAKEGISDRWGAGVGRTLLNHYDESDIKIRARAMAAAGSDARMNGCPLPVVVISGSGNQGMTVSLPVIEYAKHWNKSSEELMRSMLVANLVAILQKRYIGNLSAYCGAVCASAGVAAALSYMQGGDYETISNAITNTLSNIGGVVCDGAKSSCAAKIASSLDAAILGFTMATKEHSTFAPGEGLVKADIEATIKSFGRVAKEGMRQTDIEILNIMLED